MANTVLFGTSTVPTDTIEQVGQDHLGKHGDQFPMPDPVKLKALIEGEPEQSDSTLIMMALRGIPALLKRTALDTLR